MGENLIAQVASVSSAVEGITDARKRFGFLPSACRTLELVRRRDAEAHNVAL